MMENEIFKEIVSIKKSIEGLDNKKNWIFPIINTILTAVLVLVNVHFANQINTNKAKSDFIFQKDIQFLFEARSNIIDIENSIEEVVVANFDISSLSDLYTKYYYNQKLIDTSITFNLKLLDKYSVFHFNLINKQNIADTIINYNQKIKLFKIMKTDVLKMKTHLNKLIQEEY